jgi:beta-lactamase superfamily II metal-dependent hydrolase
MSIFRIDMLPGREGDCLWIEYGDPARPRRMLIDGGRPLAWETLKARFAALPADQRKFELLMLSHVDADHIEGLLRLVREPDLPVSFKDVWFNGRRHLEQVESLGAVQGEAFTDGIKAKRWDWNAAFDGKSVVIPDSGELPVKTLADGMRLTLLSPNWNKLEKLEPVWQRELEKAGLLGRAEDPDTDSAGVESLGALTADEVEEAARSEFEPDRSEANGSSICVLAEFDGRKAVLTGDAHAELMADSLSKLRRNGPPVALDAFKLSHHGSHGTHSVEVMKEIRSKRFLISTDGSRHKHPHVESLARTVKHAGGDIELVFNYESTHTSKWNVRGLKTRFGYTTRYPAATEAGMIRTEL